MKVKIRKVNYDCRYVSQKEYHIDKIEEVKNTLGDVICVILSQGGNIIKKINIDNVLFYDGFKITVFGR